MAQLLRHLKICYFHYSFEFFVTFSRKQLCPNTLCKIKIIVTDLMSFITENLSSFVTKRSDITQFLNSFIKTEQFSLAVVLSTWNSKGYRQLKNKNRFHPFSDLFLFQGTPVWCAHIRPTVPYLIKCSILSLWHKNLHCKILTVYFNSECTNGTEWSSHNYSYILYTLWVINMGFYIALNHFVQRFLSL